MKYLKLFKTNVDYQNYIESDDLIKPNVSYAQDTDNLYYNPRVDPIILTHESNPAVMDICYYQGWAASRDEMHKSEAEKVTDIGTAFQGLQGNTNTYGYGTYGYGSDDLTEEFTSFDEFKYFTGVTSISENAFEGCSRLNSILIPDSITTIGARAFAGCSGLTSVTIPDSVTTIGDHAFEECSGLTSVTIGSNVTSIGNYAFGYCRGLTSIVIPDSVTTIGGHAFENCSAITSVTIGNSVTSIGNYAFGGCKGLTSITIPNSVTTTIGEHAFTDCTRLTSVILGDSVTSIGSWVFDGCSVLNSIKCLAPIAPTILFNTFGNLSETHTGTLYYPSGSDYSSWMKHDYCYLGYYHWTSREISEEI